MVVFRTAINNVLPAGTIFTRPEGMPYYVLQRIKQGGVLVSGGIEYELEPGHITIFEKGHPRTIYPGEAGFKYDWIQFLPEKSDGDFLSTLSLPLNRPFHIFKPQIISEIISRTAYERNIGGQYSAAILDAHIKWLLLKTAQLSLSVNPKPKNSPLNERMRSLRGRMFAAPWVRWTSQRAADLVKVSLSHFQHTYKELFDCTFMDEVISCRIQYAKDVLVDTDHTIEVVAEKCGYNDIYHFIRQFKKLTGTTPGEYRRRYKM